MAVAVVAFGPVDAARAGVGSGWPPQLKSRLGQLLGVPAAHIVEAVGVDLDGVAGSTGVILGRYGEPDGSRTRTYPVLAVLHRCPGGTCLKLVRLGSSASAVMATQLVDLDARRTQVTLPPFHLSGQARSLALAPGARRPALLVITDQSRDGRTTHRLTVVSLHPAARAESLLAVDQLRLAAITRPGTGSPVQRTLGTRVEALTFERRGQERWLTTVERTVVTPDNRCRVPPAGERRYRLAVRGFELLSERPPPDCP